MHRLTVLSFLYLTGVALGQSWTPLNGNIWTPAKVGIGIDAPSDQLNVYGTIGINSYSTNSNHTAIWLRAGSNGGDKVRIGFRGDNQGEYAQIMGVVTMPVSNAGTATAGRLIFRTATGGILRDHVTIDETGSMLFGGPGSGMNSYSILVDDGGSQVNNGNGRDLTVRAGMSDNTAGKTGGNLILRPGPPQSPATAYGNVYLADQGGKVGIGTTAPTEKLTVDGSVKITGTVDAANIKTRAWTVVPDYVFEKDYKLASLQEVETFVQKNKHLPEVPSAKTIKEKGLDLAEMNLLLLKKVEELTLHAIRQEKEMKRQAEEIRSLKTRKLSK